jgi:predicted DNA-binding transcriptional regulator AlpA
MAKSRVSFASILSLRRKRGRPRLPSWDGILPSWDEILRLTPEEAARLDGEEWLHRLQTRNKGGRPPKRDYNQLLLEIADFADRHGIPRRTFLRDLIRATNGDVSEDLVLILVRRINWLWRRHAPAFKNKHPILKLGFCPSADCSADGSLSFGRQGPTRRDSIMSRKLRKRPTAKRYGVSTKSIDRWTQDPKLGFPQPIYINALPYWDEAELEAWERSRARPRQPHTESTELRP